MCGLMAATGGRLGLEHAPSPHFYLFCSCVHGENKETRKCQPRQASFSFPLPRILLCPGAMCSSQRGREPVGGYEPWSRSHSGRS